MIIVDNVILSDDIAENAFVCDLSRCKGACCVEGDLGAPLEKEELTQLEAALPQVKPYLSEAGLAEINKQGSYILDPEGDYSTPTINGRECAYAIYDEQKTLKCGIEQAWRDGKVAFHKPISCHLYPIRLEEYKQFIAANYDRWDICDPACELGDKLQVPIYKFLEGALKRKFGEEWYTKLLEEIEQRKQELGSNFM